METSLHSKEIALGHRFGFGKNWSRFLSAVNEERIKQAEDALKEMLEMENLEGQRFLDVGSGSGLSSLAARRLGARVYSFDYDPSSVACTAELRRRYSRADDSWIVEEGSVLDAKYLRGLGLFDIVYSWGVLHHTGSMWKALENVHLQVAAGGKLFIAIYNDMGTQSRRWHWIKKTYNSLPRVLQIPFTIIVISPEEIKSALRSLLALRPGDYAQSWSAYEQNRGMSRWRDIVDWVGGYPYEVAKPEEIFDFFRDRNFALTKLKCGRVGLGCSEFVFVKNG